LTLAGTTSANATNAAVNAETATRYADNTFAKDGFSLSDDDHTFTATRTRSPFICRAHLSPYDRATT
jgi:hypothetical protein